MALKLQGYIDLPAHIKPGGFDHAAVHARRSRLYVAHTVNDALDVIDLEADRYLRSIPGLTGIAGALVAEEQDLVFTSNRGEDSVGIFPSAEEGRLSKVRVGSRPNGLAFDPRRGNLLAANVGDPEVPASFTLSIVDVNHAKTIASIPVAGRTRWAVYDLKADAFYVNVAAPAQIVVVDASQPTVVKQSFEIPAAGPHGLDLDLESRRLFCACDASQLVILSADGGDIVRLLPLTGAPDVIFFNPSLQHLYVAIGDPGVIDVIDTAGLHWVETVSTEKGAHTLAFHRDRNKVYAFLPTTHRAAVYVDSQ